MCGIFTFNTFATQSYLKAQRKRFDMGYVLVAVMLPHRNTIYILREDDFGVDIVISMIGRKELCGSRAIFKTWWPNPNICFFLRKQQCIRHVAIYTDNHGQSRIRKNLQTLEPVRLHGIWSTQPCLEFQLKIKIYKSWFV